MTKRGISRRPVQRWSSHETLLAVIALTLVTGGCAAVAPAPENSEPLPPIRFLLTFDDGPSGAAQNNPTQKIADTLASNPTQPGIKAIFFVQSRNPHRGGSPIGKKLMQRLTADGHVFGLHSGSQRGHISHMTMDPGELSTSLTDGIADVESASGQIPDIVRPPYWAFDAATLGAYQQAGMEMLLTDLSAGDGGFSAFQADPVTGGRMRGELVRFRQQLRERRLPTIDGVVPVVVTLHDVNRYTAEHLATYFSTLIRAAGEAGLEVADPPFYSERAALLRAAHARTRNKTGSADLVPWPWGWLHNRQTVAAPID